MMSLDTYIRRVLKAGWFLLLCMAILMPSAESAQAAEQDEAEQHEADITRAQKQLNDLLQTPVTIRVEGVSFKQALDELAKPLGVRVLIDPALLKMAGINNDSRFHLGTQDTPFTSAFDILFHQNMGQDKTEAWPPPVSPQWQLEVDAQGEPGILIWGFEEPETRVYDIRQLLLPIEWDTTKPKQTKDQIKKQRQEALKQLTETLKSSAPKSHWSDQYAGTPMGGSFQELNGNLIIKTAPHVHDEIRRTIQFLYRAYGDQISLNSHLLLLDTTTFARIFSEKMPDLTWTVKGIDDIPFEQKSVNQGVSAHSLLSQKQADQLLEQSKQAGGTNYVDTMPKVTLFNRHRGYALQAAQLAYVSSYTDPAEPGKAGEPQIATLGLGRQWIFRGVLNRKRGVVTITSELQLATTTGKPIEFSTTQAGKKVTTELPQVERVDLKSTLNVPDEQWVVIVGPAIHGILDTAGSGDRDPADHETTRRLVFMIKPTIIEKQQKSQEHEQGSPKP